jgi:polar amino acid transport system substrate-binding protein
MSVGGGSGRLDAAASRQLAPAGSLLVGIAVGPTRSTLWATRENGELKGVTVDLGKAMAAYFGFGLDFVIHDSSGEIINAADSDRWTVAFAPVDQERKLRVDFGPDYYLGESTYMVRAGSGIASIPEVDAQSVRVAGVENTATLRTARRTLRKASVQGVATVEELVALLTNGGADAIALGRESLAGLLPRIPDATILAGHFHATGTAVAVPRHRPEALAAVSAFIELAKRDGTLRRIFDRNNLSHAEPAPLGSRS